MKRKQLFGIASILTGMALTACSSGGKSVSPEDEVRESVKHFVEMVSAGQLDSVKNIYPEIAMADSIAPVKSDSISVTETGKGSYDVAVAEGITVKITRSDDGAVKITESKGLFAYPAEKIEFAKNTGMWDAALSDVKLNERMKDEGFADFIKDKISSQTKNIITIGALSGSSFDTDYTQTLKNNSNVEIRPSDYVINVTGVEYYWNEEYGVNEPREIRTTKPGKAISPNGSARVSFPTYYGSPSGEIKGITWKISDEEKARRFAKFTGKEYQEYLDSKKSK